MSDAALFDALGFSWTRMRRPPPPVHSAQRVCHMLRRALPSFVWDAGVLEGNPFTYVEVKTLLDGVTVGGKRLSDQAQILNLAKAHQLLFDLIKNDRFSLSKEVFCRFNAVVSHEESLEWGCFRGEGTEKTYHAMVNLGELGAHHPPRTQDGAPELNRIFSAGVAALQAYAPHPVERAAAFFLFGALQQFFFDGNKRSSRMMMNGVLMAAGVDAVSFPAAQAQEFNQKMVSFYDDRQGDEMMAFIFDLHQQAVDQQHDAS